MRLLHASGVGLISFFSYRQGESNLQNALTQVAANDCVDGNPVRELLERSLQKLAEGYHIKFLTPLTN